jgi:hypothetical protein
MEDLGFHAKASDVTLTPVKGQYKRTMEVGLVSDKAEAQSGNKPGVLAKQLQTTLESTRRIVANYNAARSKQSANSSAKKT